MRRHPWCAYQLCGIILFAGGASGVLAENAETAADSIGLQEVVVTSQKREQNVLDVPIAVQVLSGDDLARNQTRDLGSLANLSPAVSFDGGFGPRTDSFGIRGVSTKASPSNTVQTSVAFVVDGIGLARPAELNADLGDIERVEILRGPQGTLFGKNATAGVINIINKRPTRELDGFVDVEGAKDEYVARAAIGGPITDSVRARLFVFKRHLDSLIQNINTEPGASDTMNAETHGGAGKLEIDLASNVNLLLSGNWSEDDVTVPSMVYVVQPGFALREAPILPGDRYHINRDGDSSFIPTKTYGASSDLTWSISDRWTFKSLTGFAESQAGQLRGLRLRQMWTPGRRQGLHRPARWLCIHRRRSTPSACGNRPHFRGDALRIPRCVPRERRGHLWRPGQ